MTGCEITFPDCPLPIIPMRFPLGITVDIAMSDASNIAMWVAIVTSALLLVLMLIGMRYGWPTRETRVYAIGPRHRGMLAPWAIVIIERRGIQIKLWSNVARHRV